MALSAVHGAASLLLLTGILLIVPDVSAGVEGPVVEGSASAVSGFNCDRPLFLVDFGVPSAILGTDLRWCT